MHLPAAVAAWPRCAHIRHVQERGRGVTFGEEGKAMRKPLEGGCSSGQC